MSKLDGRMIAGVLIHAALLAWIANDPYYDQGFAWALGVFVLLNVVGIAAVLGGKRKLGCILYITGCIVFVPIGLVGLLGAKRMLADLKQEALLMFG